MKPYAPHVILVQIGKKSVYDENGPSGFGTRDYVSMDAWYPGNVPGPTAIPSGILTCIMTYKANSL